MHKELTLYNTLTRSKETFQPITPGEVKIYTCGPTVYNYAHIGNLRSYIFPDLLHKLLRFIDYKVTQVINITDVGHLTSDEDSGDDKVEKAAAKLGKTAWDISKYYAEAYKKDIAALNIGEPSQFTWATEYIPAQIELVERLEKNGLTYSTEDGLYYDTAGFKDYGKMARLDIEGLNEGTRIEFGEKKNKTDFALWKKSPEDQQRQMEWESPWGKGFPGWHIECTAMIFAVLGEQIDIHTGGTDHIPVHHTNEIAQAEGATGKPFVNYWLHGEFLVLDKAQRMGKSVGNFITLQTLLDEGFHPLAYRYLALTSHYRSFLSFSFEILKSAQNAYFKLKRKIQHLLKEAEGQEAEPDATYHERILDALLDDLNAPKALGIVWEMLQDSELSPAVRLATLAPFDEQILSLNLWDASDLPEVSVDIPEQVIAWAEERLQARANKDFAESDRLRDLIQSQGFVVRDQKDAYELVPQDA